MRILKKVAIIVILIIIFSMNITKVSFAVLNTGYYKPSGPSKGDVTEAGKLIGDILAVIRNVGICIAVVMLTVIGLKYILCSLDEKASYKENMVPYIIGCFLLASATTIPSLVYEVINK